MQLKETPSVCSVGLVEVLLLRVALAVVAPLLEHHGQGTVPRERKCEENQPNSVWNLLATGIYTIFGHNFAKFDPRCALGDTKAFVSEAA